MGGAHQTVNRHSRIIELHPLPLPLGEVANSETEKRKTGFNTLSVTFGDSSQRESQRMYTALGRKMERIVTDTLHSLFAITRQNAAGNLLLSEPELQQGSECA